MTAGLPDATDPKGLIREAFRIDGITKPECRSIFLDWALSVEAADMHPLIEALLAQYAVEPDDHPMKQVLAEGLQARPRPRRRGGWQSRPRPSEGT